MKDDNVSKGVPDGDGNRLKGVEVGVTAGEILRDGGLALPPTPASPSRSTRGKEGRDRQGEENARRIRARQEGERDKNRFVHQKHPKHVDDLETSSFRTTIHYDPPGQPTSGKFSLRIQSQNHLEAAKSQMYTDGQVRKRVSLVSWKEKPHR